MILITPIMILITPITFGKHRHPTEGVSLGLLGRAWTVVRPIRNSLLACRTMMVPCNARTAILVILNAVKDRGAGVTLNRTLASVRKAF